MVTWLRGSHAGNISWTVAAEDLISVENSFGNAFWHLCDIFRQHYVGLLESQDYSRANKLEKSNMLATQLTKQKTIFLLHVLPIKFKAYFTIFFLRRLIDMYVICQGLTTLCLLYLDVVSGSGSGSSRDEVAGSSLVDPCWKANPSISAVKVKARSDERDWVTRLNPFNTLGL